METEENVFLAGSFNNWIPVRMTKQKSGQYVLIMKLSEGSYEYRFIIDGVWRHDPDHGNYVQNALGSFNSEVVVE